MLDIHSETELSLLSVTRTGEWNLDTVMSYEATLRTEMAHLQRSGRPTSFIIDIRPTGPHKPQVAAALRSVVERLGPLRADRIAIVSASGIAKLEVTQAATRDTQVFASMVLARD